MIMRNQGCKERLSGKRVPIGIARVIVGAIVFLFTLFLSLLAETTVNPSGETKSKAAPPESHWVVIPVELPLETLEESTRQQLKYFLTIKDKVEIINRIDFFPPYNRWLKKEIADLFIKAAAGEGDECFRQYLESMAYQVMSDRFFSFVPGWHRVRNNQAEIIFFKSKRYQQLMYLLSEVCHIRGDGQTLENQDPQVALAALKAKAGALPVPSNHVLDTMIYLNDQAETLHYEQYQDRFSRMGDHVASLESVSSTPGQPAAYIPRTRGVSFIPRPPRVKIANLVCTSRIPRLSMVYPDREVYMYNRLERGFKIIIFKNLVIPYVTCILQPLAEKVLSDDLIQSTGIDSNLVISWMVLHRMAHHLGPVFTVTVKQSPHAAQIPEMDEEELMSEDQTLERPGKNEKELTLISRLLANVFPATEELKADVLALHNISAMIDEGLILPGQKMNMYTIYLVYLLEQARKENLGMRRMAYFIQFNYLLEKGAIQYDITTGKLSIHEANFDTHAKQLAALVLSSYRSPYTIFKSYGLMTPELKAILEKISMIPTNVDYRFPVEKLH